MYVRGGANPIYLSGDYSGFQPISGTHKNIGLIRLSNDLNNGDWRYCDHSFGWHL